VLIAHLAASTSTLTIGAGGVMLPNHSSLVVAEQFGMLEALHPGRIDLGLGRAPGTDQLTAAALRRGPELLGADDFPEQMTELLGYFEGAFPEGHRYERITAVPARGYKPALWLLGSSTYMTFFRNSAVVALSVVVVTMLISIPAAFALSRMRFWGSATLATGVFLTYLVPDTLLFIPMFQIVKSVGLLNSYWGMVLVYPTLTVPFCTWIMIGYFQSIPKELDEAALIDGAGHMQMLFKIFIPVALPGIIAATIFAFTVSWAAFVYPMAFLYSSDQQVLTVGTVTSLIRGDVYKWGMLMAGALVAAAPPLIVYAFLMDYYIAGLTAGATKG
jgi:multiple sugar transport system permease protein